jgi:hypothetical protein
MYYNVTMKHVRATIAVVEQQLSVTYCECVFVALGIRHAISMRHICGLQRSTMFFRIIS